MEYEIEVLMKELEENQKRIQYLRNLGNTRKETRDLTQNIDG